MTVISKNDIFINFKPAQWYESKFKISQKFFETFYRDQKIKLEVWKRFDSNLGAVNFDLASFLIGRLFRFNQSFKIIFTHYSGNPHITLAHIFTRNPLNEVTPKSTSFENKTVYDIIRACSKKIKYYTLDKKSRLEYPKFGYAIHYGLFLMDIVSWSSMSCQ